MPSPLSSTKTLLTFMAPQGQWETFTDEGEEETLSLSDLPTRRITTSQLDHDKQQDDQCCKYSSSEALEDFEFQTCDNGNSLSCAADDIFYRGQLLPSNDLAGFSKGRSLSSSSSSISSSNCSSTTMSRSQSSSSRSSVLTFDMPRLSMSNKFYAHPSPRPQVRSKVHSGRRSTGSAPPGWALLRLGVVKTPEIEIHDLKLRQLRSSHESNKVCEAPKVIKKYSKPRFGFGFGCSCASNVAEPVSISPLIPKKKKKKNVEEVISIGKSSSRMFEWLEELAGRKV